MRVLTDANVPSPDVDAELLIGHVLGLTRGQVQAKAVTDAGVGPDDTVAVIEAVERRAAREPLQHICLLYTSPSPRDGLLSRMPSSA